MKARLQSVSEKSETTHHQPATPETRAPTTHNSDIAGKTSSQKAMKRTPIKRKQSEVSTVK